MEEKKMQYLFGMHPVLEAVRAGKKFDKVLLKQGLEGTQFRELMELLKENEIPFQFVPGERLNRAENMMCSAPHINSTTCRTG